MSETSTTLRHDWTLDEVTGLFALPFADLVHRAQGLHRAHFDPNRVQLSSLLNVKTGGCQEDCGYCSQSAAHETGLKAEKMVPLEDVVAAARQARDAGATRFCMGAAWRSPKERDMERMIAMIRAVKDLGLETCVTLGMVDSQQAATLRAAGLDYYNHNLDTSARYYPEVVTTRTFEDRLDTLAVLRDAEIKLCTGGIIGMGETREDRADMLRTLATLPRHPESVPINMLVPIEGTPLAAAAAEAPLDVFELVRTIAVARILMPRSYVRLSAGRSGMSDEAQALCFLAGANSMFYGDQLLTTGNAAVAADQALFARLGIAPEQYLEGKLPKSA